MHRFATSALCCLLLLCLSETITPACTSFVMETRDGPIFGANLDLFIPGDGLVLVNHRGVESERARRNVSVEEWEVRNHQIKERTWAS